MTTLDANSKIGVSILFAILGLGGGAIWKVADLAAKLDSINSRIAELVSQQNLSVPRLEYEGRHAALTSWMERLQGDVDKLRSEKK